MWGWKSDRIGHQVQNMTSQIDENLIYLRSDSTPWRFLSINLFIKSSLMVCLIFLPSFMTNSQVTLEIWYDNTEKRNFPWLLVKSLPKAQGNLESFHFNTFGRASKVFLTPYTPRRHFQLFLENPAPIQFFGHHSYLTSITTALVRY